MATPVKLKSSKSIVAARAKNRAKDRAFAADIVKEAASLTPRYQVIVRWDTDDECYTGRCAELPTAVGFGDTEAECLVEVRGNIDALVRHMIETGERPPLADEPERKAQVNIRFADYEKTTAEALAKAAGQTLSDYIRTAALRGV